MSGWEGERRAYLYAKREYDGEGYWHVLEEVLASRHETKPVHSVEEIKLLHSRFPENIKLYTATCEGRIVAGVVMFFTHTVAHSQYIASSAEGRERKALALLFRHLIGQSKDSGYAYFDFGISNEDHGQWLNEGLDKYEHPLWEIKTIWGVGYRFEGHKDE